MSRTAVPAKPRSAKSDSAAARIRSFVETSASAMAPQPSGNGQTNVRFYASTSPRRARQGARADPLSFLHIPLDFRRVEALLRRKGRLLGRRCGALDWPARVQSSPQKKLERQAL